MDLLREGTDPEHGEGHIESVSVRVKHKQFIYLMGSVDNPELDIYPSRDNKVVIINVLIPPNPTTVTPRPLEEWRPVGTGPTGDSR